jgi:hypothetical protein
MKIKLLLILIFAEVHITLLCKSIDFEVPDTVKLSVYLAKAKNFSKTSAFDSAIYYYSAAGNKYLQSGDTAEALKCDYLVIKQFVASKQDTVALSFLNNAGKKYEYWFKRHPLYEADCIQPVKDLAGGCERIIIIPDDQLFYIPFETLIADDSKPHRGFSDLDYLIKHYDVSYHYSANLWLHSKSKITGRTRPLDGFIGFAPVFKSNSQDGNIIAADLVVGDTSKNQTAMRSATSGGNKFSELIYTEKEISTGLSHGFLYAGTPNIIYSLWKIGDLNTSQLMTDFYKYVLQKKSYAHALRLAKLTLLNNEATAFPKFWSSFELVGE